MRARIRLSGSNGREIGSLWNCETGAVEIVAHRPEADSESGEWNRRSRAHAGSTIDERDERKRDREPRHTLWAGWSRESLARARGPLAPRASSALTATLVRERHVHTPVPPRGVCRFLLLTIGIDGRSRSRFTRALDGTGEGEVTLSRARARGYRLGRNAARRRGAFVRAH